MAVVIGQQAPDFSLFNTAKQKVTLSELRGQNVVLLFFPMAFTSVCTAELCHVRDNIARFNELDATVLGISVDSPFTLAKFKEDQSLNFDLLSDFNKEVSAAYGALYPEFVMELRGVAKRAAFVLDAAGILQHAEVLENAGEQPDFQKIEAALEKISASV
ncbi:redoxin domain-containing protein [Pseudocnuella soli]|uniref:redoxin domain-containing protein n=1 Tax=Pseudocnuella soli TaxID=2502779 RepID=UPI00104D3B3B|nr:peroxiredoxin [Pseudocnuella soli]